ncbi:MAG: glycoside hydrolase family 35 protein [Turicibacter sp.]
MKTVEIREEFLIDGVPTKIISGAIHYFRMVPKHWEHSLFNLKALGCNTVETYVPWNLHEEKEGVFDFSGHKDVVAFIKKAQEIGLMVIVRPSPYICAEWEFGGLPAWLLKDETIKIRLSCEKFIQKVENYFDVVIPLLVPLQHPNGGPIIMMQIENEYGSFSNDKNYLRASKDMMIKRGVTVPLFTSDGGWQQALQAGTLIDDDVLVTSNFGSRANDNFDELQKFIEAHDKQWPLMCMEFWCGWFNRWQEDIITRDAEDVASTVKDILKRGSLNFYMFHGGTNFGFMNGSCALEKGNLPQVTSYDYDALLTEAGDPTLKYFKVQEVIHDLFPEIKQEEPRIRNKMNYGEIKLTGQVSLFSTLDAISNKVESIFPQTMEQLDQAYGYILYQTKIKGQHKKEKVKVVESNDRVQVYLDHTHQITQYQDELGKEFEVYLEDEHELSILVENLGRNNYGPKLLSPTQRKGIRSGVMVDIHFETEFKQYALPLNNIEKVDFSGEWIKGTPAFYEYKFEVLVCEDTFLDCSQLGKGVAFINGFNLGRYWSEGPIQYLYLPGPLLKSGHNSLIIFETEGVVPDSLVLQDSPVYKN